MSTYSLKNSGNVAAFLIDFINEKSVLHAYNFLEEKLLLLIEILLAAANFSL